jgi:hypothetical protein
MMKANTPSTNNVSLHLTAKVPAYNPGTFRTETFDSPFATDEEALAALRERLANPALRTDPSARHLVAMLNNKPGTQLADIWKLRLHRYAAGL